MLLSIIIPVYNAEKYIEKCLSSIIRQNIEKAEYEILLIDDGSKDQSADICDYFAEKYEQIKVFHMPNGGPSAARNKGLDEAQGEYVQFIDADDGIDETLFQAMQALMHNGESDLLITGARIVDEKEQMLAEQKSDDKLYYPQGYMKEFLVQLKASDRHWALYYIWNKWYKRSVIEAHHIRFDTSIRLGEDFIFNCAFYKKAQSVSVMDQALYLYYKRDRESLTTTVRENELERRQFVDKAYCDLYKALGIYEDYKDILSYIQGEMAYVSMDSIFYTVKKYSRAEKKQYILGFMNSEYHDYILAYLKQYDNRMKQLEYRILLVEKYTRYIGIKTLYIKMKHYI